MKYEKKLGDKRDKKYLALSTLKNLGGVTNDFLATSFPS